MRLSPGNGMQCAEADCTPSENGEQGSAVVEFIFLAVLLMIPIVYPDPG